MAEDLLSPRRDLSLGDIPMGQQIQMLQGETETARDKFKAMSKSLAAVVATAQAHEEAVQTFAETFGGIANVDVLSRCRDTILALSSKRLACAKKQEEHITAMIKDIVDVRILTALGMQAKVHEAIKEHEAASEKVHSLKKGSPKLAEAQAHLVSTQQQMDLLSFAYVNKLRQTLIDVSLTTVDKLSLFFGEETLLSMSGNSITSVLLPELTRVHSDLKKQRYSNEEERAKEMKRHLEAAAASSNSVSKSSPSANLQIKQGYIFCRVSGRYKQRWVSILNARLMVYKNWKAREATDTFNLVLCNVKRIAADSSSHPYVFELRNHMDQHMQFAATDELEMTQWINIIQNCIAAQLGQNSTDANSAGQSNSEVYHLITAIKGNDKCADCRAPDPEWISMTQGITICIECSGVHRSFGSHISKVRSLKLDSLEPELVLLMTSMGNAKANAKVFEATLTDDKRISNSADRATREAFVRAKYLERRWVAPIEDLPAHLMMLMRRKNPFKPATLLATLAQNGADLNWHRPGNQKTLLHKCVATGNMVCAILLLKLECEIDAVDSSNMTALHLAAELNSAPMARLLLQHGASTTILDSLKRTPRDVAIDCDAVDCIALLDEDLNEGMEDFVVSVSPTSGSVLRGTKSVGFTSAPSIAVQPAHATNLISSASSTLPLSNPSNLGATSSGTLTTPQKARPAKASVSSPRGEEGADAVVKYTSLSLRKVSTTPPMADLPVKRSSDDSLVASDSRKGMKRTKSAKSVPHPTLALPPALDGGLPPPHQLPPPLDLSAASTSASSGPIPLASPATTPTATASSSFLPPPIANLPPPVLPTITSARDTPGKKR